MEQIKILFFALCTFFGIEDGRIYAEKTTITVSPKEQYIKIVQNDLFSIIRTEKDSLFTIQQWNSLTNLKDHRSIWAKELDNFEIKNHNLTDLESHSKPVLQLSYSNEKDLRAMGIWYDAEKKQFSINHIPQNNIKTEHGKLEGNYWVFSADSTFTFSLEPFKEIPEPYKKFKKPLKAIVLKN